MKNTSGTAAYVLSSNLPSILVFDIGNQSASAIALAGNAMPLNASLSTDGTTLYVGANDNSLQQIERIDRRDVPSLVESVDQLDASQVDGLLNRLLGEAESSL